MLLTEYVGPFRTAFWEKIRFKPGEGFPGIVSVRHEPVASDHLSVDNRYLRTRVKALEFESCCCVPLISSGQLVGVVCVGSRDHGFNLDAAVRVMSWASALVAAAIQADRLRIRDEIEAGDRDTASEPQDSRSTLELQLVKLCELLEADGSRLILLTGGRPVGAPVSVGISEDAGCWQAMYDSEDALCPALSAPRTIGLSGPRYSWYPSCRQIQGATPSVLCTPIQIGNDMIGLLQMFYERAERIPPTRQALLLQTAARALAPAARWLRDRELLQMESETNFTVQGKPQSDPAPPGKTATGEAEPHLRIRCFGTFELYRDGVYVAPRQWKRRQALTLLKILALHADTPVARDVLIEHLWPGVESALGAQRLYVLVHALREMVEPSNRGGEPIVIQTDRDRYTLTTGPACWLDLQEFQQAIDAGAQAWTRDDAQQAMSAYQHVARLYRGDLLDDEPFSEWCWLDRECLRESYVAAMRNLASLYVAAGRSEQAIDCYRRVLRADPLREEVHRQLLDVLWQLGHHAKALCEHDLFRQRLADELGIMPLPETRDLVEKIRAQGSPLRL